MVRTLDIFCGGGGSSYGARQAGAEIIAGIDMCPIATATFKDNFPKATVKTRMLEDIQLKKLRNEIGDIDLLLASPECTSHTCAKGAGPRSEESRATAMQTIRFAKAFKPRWIVLENVVHMRPWSRYAELKETLIGLGYNISEQILDASDFGTPQKRRRLFLICDREDQPQLIVPKRKIKPKTVRDILDLPGTWATTPLEKPGRATATLARAQRAIEAMGTESDFLLVYYSSDASGGWQHLDRPLRTITTVDRFAYVTPNCKGYNMRMLQVPELRRAMGFKTDFTMKRGTRRDKVRLLGNGVCPPAMKAIIENLTN